MAGLAHRGTVPWFDVTEVVAEGTAGAVPVTVSSGGETLTYWQRKVKDTISGKRLDGVANWALGSYPMFPFVRCGDGRLFAEGCLAILDKAENMLEPQVDTLGQFADDIAAYRRYCEENEVDWLLFPEMKLRRATYRYFGYLKLQVADGSISRSTANRLMSAVIQFYRRLIRKKLVSPAFPPWEEQEAHFNWIRNDGRISVEKVQTTDLRLKVPKSSDPDANCIVDGGRLRPLSPDEQLILAEALAALRNTEMTLAHFLSLSSGCRTQTALTFRVMHFVTPPDELSGNEVVYICGTGTPIDTADGKTGVLRLPKWLYERMHIYISSERYKRRAAKAGGIHDLQLVFLSERGAPFYEPNDQLLSRETTRRRKSRNKGQAVRQFIKERLLPKMKEMIAEAEERCEAQGKDGASFEVKLDLPPSANYHFQFHDLRASYGMNWVDGIQPKIDRKEISYSQAVDILREKMWHSNSRTTELYLKYRSKQNIIADANEAHFAHLEKLAEKAFPQSKEQDAGENNL